MAISRGRKALVTLLLLVQIVFAIGFGIVAYAHQDEALRWSQPGLLESRIPRIAFEWVFCAFNSMLTAFQLAVIGMAAWALVRYTSTNRVLRTAPVAFLIAAAIGFCSCFAVPDSGDHHIDLGRGLPGLGLTILSLVASATVAASNRLLR